MLGLQKADLGNKLYPESDFFLSSTRLAAIHADTKEDCLRKVHLLFNDFFNTDECQNAVAFWKHGKVPDGKTILKRPQSMAF